jgi:tetratricopeptide (TPR) repeat protein
VERPESATLSGRWKAAIAVGITLVVVLAVVRHFRGESPARPVSGSEERQLGSTAYAEGRFADAVAAWERSIAIEDDLATRTNLANALAALGRVDEALRQYHTVLARNPKDGITWFDLGNLLRSKMHDTRGAADAYRKATECAPALAEAHFDLGVTLIDLQDYEAAIASIEAALQLAPPTAAWRKDAENALLLAHVRALDKRDALNSPR